jgi:hypothetical protein
MKDVKAMLVLLLNRRNPFPLFPVGNLITAAYLSHLIIA